VAVKASFLIKVALPKHLSQFRVFVVLVVAVGYTTNDVVYRWNTARQVAIAEDMKLSQFDLIATPSANQTDILQSGRTGVALCAICKYSCNMTEHTARCV
jgi:gamma-aminobutyric acid receptor subunit alpha